MALTPPQAPETLPEGSRWVGMRRACEILGVNQSTLRQWTDCGRVPAFLTPGRHRRYREADLFALTERGPGNATTPLSTVLLEIGERYESVARRASQSNPWFRQFDHQTRHHFRLLGSSMLRLLSTHVISTSRRDRETSLRRGRRLAEEYGTLAAERGLSLAEATEAFLLFRNPVLETVHRWLEDQPRSLAMPGETLRRVTHFMDQVLVSMASAHERHVESAAGTR